MSEMIYQIQGKEFRFRDLTFSFTKDSKVLKKVFKNFANEEFSLESIRQSFDQSKDNLLTKLTSKQLKELGELQQSPEKIVDFMTPENSEFVLEYMRRVKDIVMLEEEAAEEFIDDVDNVKLILNTCLVGPVESINFDVSNEALISLREKVLEVFGDFFFIFQNRRKKSPSGTSTSQTSSGQKTRKDKKASRKNTR